MKTMKQVFFYIVFGMHFICGMMPGPGMMPEPGMMQRSQMEMMPRVHYMLVEIVNGEPKRLQMNINGVPTDFGVIIDAGILKITTLSNNQQISMPNNPNTFMTINAGYLKATDGTYISCGNQLLQCVFAQDFTWHIQKVPNSLGNLTYELSFQYFSEHLNSGVLQHQICSCENGCFQCNGKGFRITDPLISTANGAMCNTCGSRGLVQDAMGNILKCQACNGIQNTQSTCSNCGGRGLINVGGIMQNCQQCAISRQYMPNQYSLQPQQAPMNQFGQQFQPQQSSMNQFGQSYNRV